ncbi:MAG: 16S rRNA (guanine(966)-N(2))-methyltransferase RsmD [Deltaproteobacteria bacterium]|nr:16S rRNA (guanine(966)-N(2))-methyltransferase RsmD [Deltaproteobacteria bacterium]
MRIVGGTCKGRGLSSFKGLSIRPTSDKVREAVFSILFHYAGSGFSGTFRRTLDLFAGTGAMGIEALSRGSAEAVFVDKDPKSAAVIQKNIELCGLSGRASVVRKDVLDAVRLLSMKGERFDLIFIDPPYDSSLTARTLKEIDEQGLLGAGGMVVAETSKRKPLELTLANLTLVDERRYGDTLVYFFASRA